MGLSGQELAARTHPTTTPRAGQVGVTGTASGIRYLPGDRNWSRMGWDVGLQVDLSSAHGWAGQVCEELETSPTAVSLRKELAAPVESGSISRVGGAPDLGRHRQSSKSLRNRAH